MTAGRGSPKNEFINAVKDSVPVTALYETDSSLSHVESGDASMGGNQQRKGLKRPRASLQSETHVGRLARLVSRDFSSDACDCIMSQNRHSIGSDSIEDELVKSSLVPPTHPATSKDCHVNSSLLVRTTTPSPVREEQEINDGIYMPPDKIYEGAARSGPAVGPNQRTLVKHFSPFVLTPTAEIASYCDGAQAQVAKGDRDLKLASLSNSPAQESNGSFLHSENVALKETNQSINPKPLLHYHLDSMRLEKSLVPLRPLLSRLMFHPTYNRKGLFNKPVDPDALGLLDYRSIITRPMDLGTVKIKLHSVTYQNVDEAVEDIRLVFQNATKYNPPGNPVHIAANSLLEIFEIGYAAIVAVAPHKTPVAQVSAATTSTATNHGPVLPSSLNGSFQKNQQQPQHMASATLFPAPLAAVPTKKTPFVRHSCEACKGMTCSLCLQKCLHLEPAVLICAGPSCAGAKIRRGAQYHSSPDGSRCWCHRCYTSLSAILPTEDDARNGVQVTRYKRDLIKRKNDDDIVEEWIKCVTCQKGMHKVCAMIKEPISKPSDFVCPLCLEKSAPKANDVDSGRETTLSPGLISFMSGKDLPMEIHIASESKTSNTDAQSLPTDPLSSFLERKVRERMVANGCPLKAEQTVMVRTISNCPKEFRVPEVVRKHFCMETRAAGAVNDTAGKAVAVSRSSGLSRRSCGFVPPPKAVQYHSKAIALFQRIDGVDVCIFCMYVQEYEKTSSPELEGQEVIGQNKRAYIAYLDSVEHFRPRECRTAVYQEMLVAYLAASRARGFESAHIWACPPTRGNSFVFWVHPFCQRTPTRDRLEQWYHQALGRAVATGVVSDIKSLYEVAYEEKDSKNKNDVSGRDNAVCPPLLDGDYWMEEAALIHQAHIARYLKIKPSAKSQAALQQPQKDVPCTMPCATQSKCPTIQVASLLEHRVFINSLSLPFQRPVNAAALNLHDYHGIITQPMDLGTVHIRCLLGDYETLVEMVDDVELVVQNATRYNPPGNIVHKMALDLKKLFFSELNQLAKWWTEIGVKDALESELGGILENDNPGEAQACPWKVFKELSMRLGTAIDVPSATDGTLGTDDCKPEEIKQAIESEKASPVVPLVHQEVPSQGNGTLSLSTPLLTTDDSTKDVPSSACKQCPTVCISTSNSSESSSNLPQAKRPREEDRDPRSELAEDCLDNQQAKKRKLGASASSRASITVGVQTKPIDLPNLRTGGPEAVARRMVGSDTWMLDRKHAHSCCPSMPQPNHGSKKKKSRKQKASKKDESSTSTCQSKGERKESWLAGEVGEVIRRMRRDFYVCDLRPQDTEIENVVSSGSPGQSSKEDFEAYMGGFLFEEEGSASKPDQVSPVSPRVADARHALLEFSQQSHLQFDTLRRAKYSTAILLDQLHNKNSNTSRLIPSCTACKDEICGVRWHRTRKAVDDRYCGKTPRFGAAKAKVAPSKVWEPQELCTECYRKVTNQDDFVPLRVSFRRVTPSC